MRQFARFLLNICLPAAPNRDTDSRPRIADVGWADVGWGGFGWPIWPLPI